MLWSRESYTTGRLGRTLGARLACPTSRLPRPPPQRGAGQRLSTAVSGSTHRIVEGAVETAYELGQMPLRQMHGKPRLSRTTKRRLQNPSPACATQRRRRARLSQVLEAYLRRQKGRQWPLAARRPGRQSFSLGALWPEHASRQRGHRLASRRRRSQPGFRARSWPRSNAGYYEAGPPRSPAVRLLSGSLPLQESVDSPAEWPLAAVTQLGGLARLLRFDLG